MRLQILLILILLITRLRADRSLRGLIIVIKQVMRKIMSVKVIKLITPLLLKKIPIRAVGW